MEDVQGTDVAERQERQEPCFPLFHVSKMSLFVVICCMCLVAMAVQALAALVACVEWGAEVGLSELRGHLGKGADEPGSLLPRGAAGLVAVGSGTDRQGRPLAIVRLGRLTEALVESCGRKSLLRCVAPRCPCQGVRSASLTGEDGILMFSSMTF